MFAGAWAVYGILSAALTAVMMLLQERWKVEPFSLALWCKIACVVALLPVMPFTGFPPDPWFYIWTFPTAVIFAIADVILFRHLPLVGAGVVSRVLPVTVIVGFFLWFAADPSIISKYTDQPMVSAGIVGALCTAAFFSMRLRKCEVSMKALRVLWFVMCSNVAGPMLTKAAMQHAEALQGAIAYTFVQALMMVAIWLCWLFAAKPVAPRSLVQRKTWQPGLLIGVVMVLGVTVYVLSVAFVDNPGYVSAIRLVNTVMILGAHRMMGKRDESDVVSGLGIVAAAAALIVLKEQL
jgi:hypothetical protein